MFIMYGYIYKITNLVNSGVYIGQTSKSITERFSDHVTVSNNYVDGTDGYSHLYRAMKKYGVDNFIVEEIDSGNSKEELNEKERYWIAYYRSQDVICYNIADGGTGGNTWDNHTDEEKLIIGNKISTANTGKKYGPHSDETKKKISVAVIASKQNRSEEQKKLESLRKSQAALNRAPMSEESKKKTSENNKGKHFKTPEEKEHLRQKALGKIGILRDGVMKYIYPDELQTYLDQGWKKQGKKHILSEESKASANLKRKIARESMSDEQKESLRNKKSLMMLGENNPMYGSTYKWMNDQIRNYRIPPDQVDYYVQIGYELGRVRKCTQSQ